MPQQGQKSITLSGEQLKRLEKEYKKEREKVSSKSFASFIAESAIIELERKQILRESQIISLIALQGNTIFLKDVRKSSLIEVTIKDKEPYCLHDSKSDCIHVGFVLALPEVNRKLR